MILRAGQEVIGMSTGRIPPGDNETWCWNQEMKDAIRVRKQAKKKWETPVMGPDGMSVWVWKSLGEGGVDMLLDLLQKIFE